MGWYVTMQIRETVSRVDIVTNFRLKVAKVAIFLVLCLTIGIATTQLQLPVLLALAAGLLGFFLLIRYLEVGLIYYATFFGLFSSGLIGPIYDLLDIPPGLRTPLIGILFVFAGILFIVTKKPPQACINRRHAGNRSIPRPSLVLRTGVDAGTRVRAAQGERLSAL